MSEEHTTLDMNYDRNLLEDVFDLPDLRYVALYMFIIRKELFQDLEDDDLISSFDIIINLEELTVADLQRTCEEDFITQLIKFHVITNIKSMNIFKTKAPDFKVRMAPGIKLAHEDLTDDEEEIHLFCEERFLERIIAPDIPEMSANRIHKALERLRAMMCPKSSIVHNLIHKYGDYYVLDDDFYYIIEEIGNPYQALRIELMIRAMSDKYKEMEEKLNDVLSQIDPELPKATMMKKFREAKEKGKPYLEYLVKKSRKKSLAQKYRLNFAKDEEPELYTEFKETLIALIGLKLQFDDIDNHMNDLRNYYSGKNQIMPYMTFIEKTTYDEDQISEKIKDLLLKARNSLKQINDGLADYSAKDVKILNLDLERYIIDEDLLEEDDE